MIILSRHSLFHYLHYLVMNRDDQGDEFLESLRSNFWGLKVWSISQKTRNVLFELELDKKRYILKHYIPLIEGKRNAFQSEIKSGELADIGFALRPLFIDQVSNVVVYEKYLLKSYLNGLADAREGSNKDLEVFAEKSALFFSELHNTNLSTAPILSYQNVIKNRPYVPEELQKDQIEFCRLWRSSGIIHGDPHGGNLFCDNKAQDIRLIDWETICLGDPYYDLAIFFRGVMYTICGEAVLRGKLNVSHKKLRIYVEKFAQTYNSFDMLKIKIFSKTINADLYNTERFVKNMDYFFSSIS